MVQKKKLYTALQEKLGKNSSHIMSYLKELKESIKPYEALSSPDSAYWSGIATDVRDEIVAHRRFSIEAPFAMYLAAQRHWRPVEFCNLIKAGTAWAIRASLVGGLGGGTAEKFYGDAARGISDGTLKNVNDVRNLVISRSFAPNDHQFLTALLSVTNNSRAKYLLAMIEKEYWKESNANIESMPLWDSKSISVEHIFAQSAKVSPSTDGSNSLLSELQFSIPNLALLERSVNNTLGDDDFPEKKSAYKESAFLMTSELSSLDTFDDNAISKRRDQMLSLATAAWPV